MRLLQALVERHRLRDGYRESRRCSADTFPESCITKYASIRRKKRQPSQLGPEFRLGFGEKYLSCSLFADQGCRRHLVASDGRVPTTQGQNSDSSLIHVPYMTSSLIHVPCIRVSYMCHIFARLRHPTMYLVASDGRERVLWRHQSSRAPCRL